GCGLGLLPVALGAPAVLRVASSRMGGGIVGTVRSATIVANSPSIAGQSSRTGEGCCGTECANRRQLAKVVAERTVQLAPVAGERTVPCAGEAGPPPPRFKERRAPPPSRLGRPRLRPRWDACPGARRLRGDREAPQGRRRGRR